MTIEDIKKLVKEMCNLRAQGKYVPILEADLSALLFHLILSRHKAALHRVHLDTRVIGAHNNNDRFDLVIGDMCQRKDKRPAVSPEVIIEIKMFPIGFRDQQHRVHFEHILNDDFRKLGTLQMKTAMKVEFIFDEVNYLGGIYHRENRKGVIVSVRKSTDTRIKIVFARKEAGKWDVTVE